MLNFDSTIGYRSGGRLELSRRVLNQGSTGTPIGTPSQLQVWLSKKATLVNGFLLGASQLAGHLSAGGWWDWTNELTIPMDVPSGSYYLVTVADPVDAISETDEKK